jgi:hypothetical protein
MKFIISNCSKSLNLNHIIEDSARLFFVIVIFLISYNYNLLILWVSLISCVFSISWLIGNIFSIIRYEKLVFLSYLPAVNDCLGLTIFTYLTGNVNSMVPIFYIGIFNS